MPMQEKMEAHRGGSECLWQGCRAVMTALLGCLAPVIAPEVLKIDGGKAIELANASVDWGRMGKQWLL
jgi:hypothetical protein